MQDNNSSQSELTNLRAGLNGGPTQSVQSSTARWKQLPQLQQSGLVHVDDPDDAVDNIHYHKPDGIG